MSFIIKKDYYKILGIGANATQEEIKAAYRKAAKEFHPDFYPNNPLVKLADERLKEINEAYEVLSDEEKRKQYDDAKVDGKYTNTTKTDEKETDSYENSSQRGQNSQRSQRKHSYKEEDNYNKKKTSNNFYGDHQHEHEPDAPCHIHANKPGVEKCSICGAYLCNDCANAFDVLMCPECLILNNDMYIRTLKIPSIYTASSFLIGAGIGVMAGIEQKMLNDYGALEGLIFGVYIMSVCLYILYMSTPIYKAFFKVFKILFYVFDLNINTVSGLANLMTIIIGVSAGWILGLPWGIVRLKRDTIAYYKYKPEYIKTREFIKEKFGV